MTQPNTPPQRVSPILFPEKYELPGKPESSLATVQDAFRQTQFLLADDLRLFAEGAALQLEIARGSAISKFRTHPLAAMVTLWARSFAAVTDAMVLVSRGSYISVPALARAAAEYVAAGEALRLGEMEIYLSWLTGTLGVNERFKATEFELGRYFAGETLAANERLRSVYRPASELGRPGFGASLLLTGSDSNRTRIQVAFGDLAFHLGWAEVTLGWLLTLSSVQLGVALHAREIFQVGEEPRLRVLRWTNAVETILAAPDRCRVTETEDGRDRRYVVDNFRRTRGAAPKRFVL